MMRAQLRLRYPLAALAAACFIAMSPRAAIAQGDPQRQPSFASRQGGVVVEQVENGPVFAVEFKFTEINGKEAYLLGGYAGAIFDNKLLVGGGGYWQVDDYWNHYDNGCHDCYDYYDYDDGYGYHATGYGGLIVEAYPLRSPAISLGLRALVGGGVTTVGWNGYYGGSGNGSRYPQPQDGYYDYGYYGYDQTYFIFEPQVNLSVRVARGVAIVGGAGYRVIGWANGWEDQIGGLTGTFAIRFGGR
jgi:hypothetical protein